MNERTNGGPKVNKWNPTRRRIVRFNQKQIPMSTIDKVGRFYGADKDKTWES